MSNNNIEDRNKTQKKGFEMKRTKCKAISTFYLERIRMPTRWTNRYDNAAKYKKIKRRQNKRKGININSFGYHHDYDKYLLWQFISQEFQFINSIFISFQVLFCFLWLFVSLVDTSVMDDEPFIFYTLNRLVTNPMKRKTSSLPFFFLLLLLSRRRFKWHFL